MQDELNKRGMTRYFRPFPLLLCLGLVTFSAVGAIAMVNRTSIVNFVAGWNTQQVSVTELVQGKYQNIILIDVRSPEEYAEDRIGNSELIPLTEIQADFGIKQIYEIAAKNKQASQVEPTIVLYCTSGLRSLKAYKRLEKTGLTGLDFVVLTGGIKAWRQAVPPEKDTPILAPLLLDSRKKAG